LVIAAAVLYIPANYYPVLTVVQLGAGAPSTILGGVEELLTARQYPLAALGIKGIGDLRGPLWSEDSRPDAAWLH
jgi:hypothetical protein